MMKTFVAAALFIFFARGAHGRCQVKELAFDWPIGGVEGKTWVINNYIDHDPGSGVRDYKGGGKTYNGHNGVDIDLANQHMMEEHQFALAAAPGKVVEVQQEFFDHNYEAPAMCPWNHVYVQHDNGFVSWYGHLKFGSARVRVGDRVNTSQVLGEVGSSGCSSVAHLHFEVHDCADKVVDPFEQGMFPHPPAYDPPLSLMDFSIRKGGFPTTTKDAVIKDPNPNAFGITPGTLIGFGLSLSGGHANEKVEVRVLKPDGNLLQKFGPMTMNGTERHSWPRWLLNMPKPMATGKYKAQVLINNAVVVQKYLTSQSTPDALVFAKTDEAYQENFDSLTAANYTPIVVDGSEATEGRSRFTAIFRYRYGAARAYHNLDDAGYKNAYASARAAGLQLTSLDNYMHDGQPLIAAIFSSPIASDWAGFHLSSRNEHQQNFENMKAKGYRPYIVSIAVGAGRYWISSAYTKTRSRGWTARYDLSFADYQKLFDSERAAGRGLDFIDVYQNGSTPMISAIWTAEANDWPWEARHNLSEAQFNSTNETKQQAGMTIRWVTSYMENGERKFAAIWRGGPVR